MSNQKYEKFGVMLDCSRNAVLKVSAVKQMIDCLAKMGYNVLELYTEDTYEVENEPFMGYLRGRYTSKEIKEIDAYAQAKGIELIPCIQTLAHFSAFVKNGEINGMVDTADILLIGEERTYRLLDNIFASLAKNFTSRNVNIGMDEAFLVGCGKYLNKHGYKDRFELILEHLTKVAEIAKKYGFKMHMWSDMFFRLANKGTYHSSEPVEIPVHVKNSVPKDVELVYWDYYSTEKNHYDAMFKSHQGFNGNIWFAGGAWTWDGFAPYHTKTLNTMRPAMESVIEHKIKNVLVTMWGDNGAECSLFSLMPALYAVRQFADGNFDMETIKRGFNALFGLDFDTFALLEIPNKLNLNEKMTCGNPCKCLFYPDPFMGLMDHSVEVHDTIPYGQYRDLLKSASTKMNEYSYLFETMSALCDVLDIKAELGVKTRKAYKANDKQSLECLVNDYQELVKRLENFHELFYNLWHKENKPQGWEIQDARLGGLMQRIKTCAKRLRAYLEGEIDDLEELEETILPLWNGSLWGNNYASLISRSIV